jgi:hypothetical protein
MQNNIPTVHISEIHCYTGCLKKNAMEIQQAVAVI